MSFFTSVAADILSYTYLGILLVVVFSIQKSAKKCDIDKQVLKTAISENYEFYLDGTLVDVNNINIKFYKNVSVDEDAKKVFLSK